MNELTPGQGCRHPTGSVALVTRADGSGIVYYLWEDGSSGTRYPGHRLTPAPRPEWADGHPLFGMHDPGEGNEWVRMRSACVVSMREYDEWQLRVDPPQTGGDWSPWARSLAQLNPPSVPTIEPGMWIQREVESVDVHHTKYFVERIFSSGQALVWCKHSERWDPQGWNQVWDDGRYRLTTHPEADELYELLRIDAP